MDKKITVLYFANLAYQADKDEEAIQVDEAMNLPNLYQHLCEKYQFNKTPKQLKVAINHNFADWTDQITDGDCVAFIPPVAGG